MSPDFFYVLSIDNVVVVVVSLRPTKLPDHIRESIFCMMEQSLEVCLPYRGRVLRRLLQARAADV